jgi:hypothetical protein
MSALDLPPRVFFSRFIVRPLQIVFTCALLGACIASDIEHKKREQTPGTIEHYFNQLKRYHTRRFISADFKAGKDRATMAYDYSENVAKKGTSMRVIWQHIGRPDIYHVYYTPPSGKGAAEITGMKKLPPQLHDKTRVSYFYAYQLYDIPVSPSGGLSYLITDFDYQKNLTACWVSQADH